MSGDDGTEPSDAAVAADADPINADGANVKNKANRKRRLSKRERKNLKNKKKKLAGGGGGDDVPSATAIHAATTTEECSVKKEGEQEAAAASEKSKPEPTLEEYMANYIPAPSAITLTKENEDDDNSKSLGKWFPKASVIKSSVCYSNDYLAKLAKEKKKKQKKSDSPGEKPDGDATAETVEPKASLVLFYQYVNPTWNQAKVSSFLAYLTTIAEKHRTNIGGRIRVSSEGVNATVSAASTSQDNPAFEAAQTLRHFAQDLRQFDKEAFENTDLKYVDDLSADRHFKELKLLPVKELVFYGIRDGDCAVQKAPSGDTESGGSKGGKEVKGGIHLDAKDYHEMLKQKNTVVIDVRNHYEAAIGRFDGQVEGKELVQDSTTLPDKDSESNGEDSGDDKKEEGAESKEDDVSSGAGGAEYIDPKMRKSTDFTSWLAEPKTKQKLEGKTVMMFCTGGIRCERASAYLNSKMGSEVKGVYQLQGGIERYLQAFPEGGFWRGKNFVFDKREAIGAGNINGDGGVVSSAKQASKGKKGKEDENKLLSWGTECAKCHKPWDRYIGKRKCYTCGVPVLVCDTCMSLQSSGNKKTKKKNKVNKDSEGEKADAAKNDGKYDSKSQEGNNRIRCPLCIEEGVTVAAEEVEFTHNGIGSRLKSPSDHSDTPGAKPAADGSKKKKGKKEKDSKEKAAKSVLKWGGGHATKKKEKRKFSRRVCQFGAECVRKDCFFYHPERGKKNHVCIKKE